MLRQNINPYIMKFTVDNVGGEWVIMLNGKTFRRFSTYESMVDCLKAMR